jgi:hypothetical protein
MSVAKVGSPWRQFRLWWFGISRRRDDPDENSFTLTRAGTGGTMAAVLGVKKEIPANFHGAEKYHY